MKIAKFALRILFLDALAVLCLWAVAASAKPAPYTLSVSHNASGRGVISPGCAAAINLTGGKFTTESQQGIQNPLPLSLAGVSVTVGGQPAAIWLATENKLAIIAPDVVWPPRVRRVTWFQVVVTTPTDTFTGWAAYAPTAPGIYEQKTNGITHPQGLWRFGEGAVNAISDAPITVGSRVVLFGTGMQRADVLRAWIDDGVDMWILPATLAVVPQQPGVRLAGWAGFAWIDGVAFDLPEDASGLLTLVIQGDQMWSQEVQILVMRRPSLP
jgi:uncharacterized protein (TIGR03437 family)